MRHETLHQRFSQGVDGENLDERAKSGAARLI